MPGQGTGVSRIAAAKRELIAAINALESNVSFGIVAFHRDSTLFRSQLVEADATIRAAAIRFVEGAKMELGTSTYDALLAAFKYDAEAIYLLTDGVPASGQIVNPQAIVNAITRKTAAAANRFTRSASAWAPRGAILKSFCSDWPRKLRPLPPGRPVISGGASRRTLLARRYSVPDLDVVEKAVFAGHAELDLRLRGVRDAGILR